MPIFIKSAIPRLSTRTAFILQVGLFAFMALLAFIPRDDQELPVTAQAEASASPEGGYSWYAGI